MSIKIYVGNLSFDSSEQDLKGLFSTYGEVESAKIIVDQFTNRSRGFGFIEMTERDDGLKAIQALNSSDLDGRSLKVNEAKPKTENRNRGGGSRDSRW
ncbi:MAG: RNA-binding protein [Desulfomonilaceae bacterium]|nr:RNA-binding protein [Desulfomonilaceae bacterium]